MIAPLFLKIAVLLFIQFLNGDATPHQDEISDEEQASGTNDCGSTPGGAVQSSGGSGCVSTTSSEVIWPDEVTLNKYLDITYKKIQINVKTKVKVKIDLYARLGKIMSKMASYDICYDFEIQFKGSSYEGLRIGKPDEYDFGLVNDSWTGQITRQTANPPKPGFGYAFDDTPSACFDRFKVNNRLDPAKVRGHLKELVKKAMKYWGMSDDVVWEQGPAVSFTYKPDIPEIGNVDVDLAIGIHLLQWPPEARDLPEKLKKIGAQLVPKQLESDPMLWQISFAQVEVQIMADVDKMPGFRKNVLMLAKYFKGMTLGKWDPLSSYHLKMVFFHMLEDIPDSKDWAPSKLVTRFQDFVMRLLGHVRSGILKSVFVPDYNLFEGKTDLYKAEEGINLFLKNLQSIRA